MLTNRDLEEAYKGLDLLDKLVPPPMNVLLGKGKLQLSGEMLSYSQLDHSQAGGTSSMENNELEMMCFPHEGWQIQVVCNNHARTLKLPSSLL